MSISTNKDIKPNDPIDILIFEKGIRIKTLFIEKELDLLLVILNNGNIIKSRISSFDKLKNAGQDDLSLWELRNEGIGISWKGLDEDLSLHGFIKEATFQATLDQLLRTGPDIVVA
jgi:hypothetical protein